MAIKKDGTQTVALNTLQDDVLEERLLHQKGLQPKPEQMPFANSYQVMIEKLGVHNQAELAREQAPGIKETATIFQKIVEEDTDSEFEGRFSRFQTWKEDSNETEGQDEWLKPLMLALRQERQATASKEELVERLKPVAAELLNNKQLEPTLSPKEVALLDEAAIAYEQEMQQDQAQQEMESTPNPNKNLDVMAALCGLSMWAGGTRMVLPVYGYIAGELMQNNPSKAAWFMKDQRTDARLERAIVKAENLEHSNEVGLQNRQERQEERRETAEAIRDMKVSVQELQNEQQVAEQQAAEEQAEKRPNTWPPTPSPLD